MVSAAATAAQAVMPVTRSAGSSGRSSRLKYTPESAGE